MIEDEEWDDDDFDDYEADEEDEMVLNCGYPDCCMPGYHLRSECHNPTDIANSRRPIRQDPTTSAQEKP